MNANYKLDAKRNLSPRKKSHLVFLNARLCSCLWRLKRLRSIRIFAFLCTQPYFKHLPDAFSIASTDRAGMSRHPKRTAVRNSVIYIRES